MIHPGDVVRFSRAGLAEPTRGVEVIPEARRLVVGHSHSYDAPNTVRVRVSPQRDVCFPREWVELDDGYDLPVRVIYDHDHGDV